MALKPAGGRRGSRQPLAFFGRRPSWDLIAVYLAVMGPDSLYSSELPGTDVVDTAGNERFDSTNTSSNQAQVWIDGARHGDVVRMR